MAVCLVTGGTGFTGSHLVRRLLGRGDAVRVLDNQPGIAHDELVAAGAEVTLGSITDASLVDQLTEGVDTVYHVAAAFRDVRAPRSVYRDVNVHGTEKLLDAALRYRVPRFVNCSTQGVHGHIRQTPGNEQTPIAPADLYQASKYEGELVCRRYLDRGVAVVTLRPTAIYGPGDPGRWLMLFKHARRGRFFMFGSGRTTYHPCYIDNLVDAFLLAADPQRADVVGDTFLIGDADYHTLNDLVAAVGRVVEADTGQTLEVTHLPLRPLWLAALGCELVCKPFGVTPPIFRRRVDWFRQVRGFDLGHAREGLGYVPGVGLDEGLTRTYRWYRDHGYLD